MLTLVIGNKRYSSWSLRAWLALRQTGKPFREIRLPLFTPEFEKKIKKYSPGGKVPCLKDGTTVVWESLAICEYLAERFPEAGLWPKNTKARAHARAISNEMHAGFMELRKNLPMDCTSKITKIIPNEAAEDIARVTAIWREARKKYGQGGPFLFGRFSIADAMYAPVTTRFASYGVKVDAISKRYLDAILALPAMREWIAAAKSETEIISH